jgi:hypothetical protein
MGKEESIPWKHQQLIDQFGGKTASLLVQEKAHTVDVLPFSIYTVGQEIPLFDLASPPIVRPSGIGDHNGLVDMLDTQPFCTPYDLNGKPDEGLLRQDIGLDEYRALLTRGVNLDSLCWESGFSGPRVFDMILERSKRPEVLEYARWEGHDDFDGVKSFIVQWQNNSQLRGSVVDHPNFKGYYVVNFVSGTFQNLNLGNRNCILQYLVDCNGKIVTKIDLNACWNNTYSEENCESLLPQVVRLHQMAREAGFVPSQFSSHVEFCVLSDSTDIDYDSYTFASPVGGPLIFSQERAFMPFDPCDYVDVSDGLHFYGNIPEEPLELRVVKVGPHDGFMEFISDDIPSLYVFHGDALKLPFGLDLGEEWVYDPVSGKYNMVDGGGWHHSSDHSHFVLPMGFRPDNMAGFYIPWDNGCANAESLEHNTFRWVQKAGLSILNVSRLDLPRNYDLCTSGEYVTIKRTNNTIL